MSLLELINIIALFLVAICAASIDKQIASIVPTLRRGNYAKVGAYTETAKLTPGLRTLIEYSRATMKSIKDTVATDEMYFQYLTLVTDGGSGVPPTPKQRDAITRDMKTHKEKDLRQILWAATKTYFCMWTTVYEDWMLKSVQLYQERRGTNVLKFNVSSTTPTPLTGSLPSIMKTSLNDAQHIFMAGRYPRFYGAVLLQVGKLSPEPPPDISHCVFNVVSKKWQGNSVDLEDNVDIIDREIDFREAHFRWKIDETLTKLKQGMYAKVCTNNAIPQFGSKFPTNWHSTKYIKFTMQTILNTVATDEIYARYPEPAGRSRLPPTREQLDVTIRDMQTHKYNTVRQMFWAANMAYFCIMSTVYDDWVLNSVQLHHETSLIFNVSSITLSPLSGTLPSIRQTHLNRSEHIFIAGRYPRFYGVVLLQFSGEPRRHRPPSRCAFNVSSKKSLNSIFTINENVHIMDDVIHFQFASEIQFESSGV